MNHEGKNDKEFRNNGGRMSPEEIAKNYSLEAIELAIMIKKMKNQNGTTNNP